jgi:hypothetical protein
MMNGRFLKHSAIDDLRANIKENLPLYRDGDFEYLAVDSSFWFEAKWQFDESQLTALKMPVGEEKFEVYNSITAYNALSNMNPYDARDERFWVYLTHTILLDYSRNRWPIPKDDDEAVAFIKAHFFAKEKRQVERDNAISRLWWMAYLCSRVPSLEIEEALEAFLFRADVRASIIERPSTSQSISLFSALLKKLSESYKGGQKLFVRETFRDMMIEINSIGGSKLLDYLNIDEAESVLDGIIKHRLQLSSI